MTDPRSRRRPAPDAQPRPAAGQLLKRTVLGSDAVYRVIGENPRGIELEVVDVPGLEPGSRFTFTSEDVRAMEALDSPDSPPVRPPVRGAARRRFA